MRAGGRRGPGGLQALLVALGAAAAALALGAAAYNLAPERAVLFQGPPGSFFGYAVLQHFHDNTRWVLVGAPKADSKFSTSVKSPGAVFKCRVHTNPDRRCTELDMARGKSRGTSCGKTCREDRDDEWMGVSLARQPRADGQVLACAHRWKNIYYETDYILPHGFCYVIPANLQTKGRTLIPCYEEYKKKYGEEHGSCQAGIAGFFTSVSIVMVHVCACTRMCACDCVGVAHICVCTRVCVSTCVCAWWCHLGHCFSFVPFNLG
ncbi:integrin alpha-9 [Monodelphis domestica]|uniref:integrin alpha-9 n=1 Tax=Monodelphis domestica TaxID=13616 RepID=UPI0024E222EB|nr:integrin alpha-9 [Monodelphis domestica]